jgi:ribose transport system permease protein
MKVVRDAAQRTFVRLGVLPFLLAIAVVVFTLLSDRFLSPGNIVSLLRQSVYLVLVALGQMLALITGGFDLSVGTTLAVTSVVSATVMSLLAGQMHVAPFDAIALGSCAGIAAGGAIGLLNGIGVAYLDVSPFIVTLATQSIGFGFALFLTGGVPVSGLPAALGDVFGFGNVAGVPVPILIMLVCIVVFATLLDRTRIGSYLYAVGGNVKAAALSGIDTARVYLLAYLLCAVVASIAGLLLTARTGSGEATIGGTVALQSIAACIIAGVSLRGGIGRVENVVLGAIFIGLVQNGMDLAAVGSYLQMVVLGLLLVIAAVSDRVRRRYFTLGK